MGGQITRAIYKNQRRTPIKENASHSQQIKEVSVKFTQVMTMVLVFVTGYLYRPYLHHQSTEQNEITGFCLMALINIAGWQLSKYKSQKVSQQKHNQKFNQELIKFWNFIILVFIIILLFFDIVQAISKSQLILAMGFVYKVILFASINTAVYSISQIKSFQKIRNNNLSQQATFKGVQRTLINFNQNVYIHRAIFIFITLQVFKKGLQISTIINQIKNNTDIKHPEDAELYFETFSLRIIFCALMFMISAVCIALQKKTLVYMRLNYQLLIKENSNQNQFKNSFLHLAFSSFMFICLAFLLVNGSSFSSQKKSSESNVEAFTSIALAVASISLCLMLIKSAKKLMKYKNQNQEAFLINLLILIMSIIHFYIPQTNIEVPLILKMALTILLIFRFVNIWDKNSSRTQRHQLILNIVIFFCLSLVTMSSKLSIAIFEWCELYFDITQTNKQRNSLLIILSCLLIVYSLLHVLLDITKDQSQQRLADSVGAKDEQKQSILTKKQIKQKQQQSSYRIQDESDNLMNQKLR